MPKRDNMQERRRHEISMHEYHGSRWGKDMVCSLCGRKYPETVLHITGWMYFREQLKCLDEKDCKKARKK